MGLLLERVDGVHVLHLGADENRFTLGWLDEVEKAVDEVVAAAPTALVTLGDDRFYSNGLHVETLFDEATGGMPYSERVQRLLARFLTLPVPTIAAVNGHAFGAGAMLAMAHDFRVMNAEKGFFCFPEVDIKIPFTPGMAALIQAKLTPAAAVESMTTGRRYGGPDAADRGIVDRAVAPDALLPAALEVASQLVEKDSSTLGAIKGVMYAAPAAALGA